ncbi:unnamed protein product [Mytilus coruscus]|uniref:4Fe-4S ferredoxin-type domain-containing protein n=1 Tax=Mytilus coruscus TaxID=42192 RepID=A0A6J8AP93_MYTCO|nr:unnamed protein product [Mytilus coruscus]
MQIPNLESGTLYEIKIFVEDSSGDEALLFKIEVRTIPSIASKLLKNADKISDKPTIFRLRPAKTTNTDKDILIHEFFSDGSHREEKTLLLVGASGSGKSTLVNAIVNYATDVSFADKFRFKITDDRRTTLIPQRTEDIVCYKIRWQDGFKVEFNLNVIEVPGFGSGNNAIIYRKLINLFRSIEYISAACLVVPSFSRLTAEQRCIFNNILSIFGKDINYVIPLITFDDGGEIKALSSLTAAKVPYVEHMHFRFNNSQLLSGNEHVEIWNKRQSTMHNLFGEPTVFVNYSVDLTNEVLKVRTNLIVSLHEARTRIQQIERMETIIEDYDLNKGRQQQNPEKRARQLDADKICINCNMCKQTCIFNCSLAVRCFWFCVCFLESVWSFVCCICSRLPCCSRICRCSCKRAYCCCIKCLHRCLGCKCSCSFAHHEKEYGRYKDDIRDTFRNTQEVTGLTGCEIENNDEKLKMIDDKKKLINEVVKKIDNISIYAGSIKKSALFDELPPEIESLKKYRKKLLT